MESNKPHRLRGILFGCCIGIAVLLVLTLGFTLASLVALFGSEETTTANNLKEIVIRPAETKNKIALIPIHGLILSDGYTDQGIASAKFIINAITTAENDNRVRAIILDIDSPGGAVVASSRIAEAVASAQKPVIALFAGEVAASGAVYAAVGADAIVSHPDTLTGSIGVVAEFVDISELLQKYGIKVTTVKSGPFKDIGSLTREMTDAERAMLQGLIDESYSRFVAAVVAGRHLDEATVRSFADGRIFSGATALNLKLVDELGNFDTALERALKQAQIDKAQVIQYKEPFSFSSLLSLLGMKFQGDGPLALLKNFDRGSSLQLYYVME